MSPSAELCSEIYAKKLIGRTEIEDALKRLDKLTHEEARMATAENMKASHSMGESVREVVEKMEIFNNRTAGVSHEVASVGNTVKSIGAVVAGIDDRLRFVVDNVAEAICGMLIIFNQSPKLHFNPEPLRWKGCETSHATNSHGRKSNKTFVHLTSPELTTEPYASLQ
jgi:hypothetical protein